MELCANDVDINNSSSDEFALHCGGAELSENTQKTSSIVGSGRYFEPCLNCVCVPFPPEKGVCKGKEQVITGSAREGGGRSLRE